MWECMENARKVLVSAGLLAPGRATSIGRTSARTITTLTAFAGTHRRMAQNCTTYVVRERAAGERPTARQWLKREESAK